MVLSMAGGSQVMARLVVVFLAAGALLAGGGSESSPTPRPSPDPSVDPVDSYVRIYGGLAGVCRSILDETSCDELQGQFFTATENGSLGYQAAIDDRSRELDCPELLFDRP